MAVSQPKNPTRRKAMAKRKMNAAEFERNIKPLIEQERMRLRQAIRERMQATDPIRQRALAPLQARDQWQQTKFQLSQPAPLPQSTTEDRAQQEQALGLGRPLDEVLLKGAERMRRK